MKKALSTIIATIAVTLSLTGCFKQDDIVQSAMSIGEMTRPDLFISDEGLTLHITDSSIGELLPATGRIIIIYDIINELVKDKEFNVKATAYYPVSRKNPVASNENDLDGENKPLGSDPVRLNSGWVSGGYLNVEAWILTKRSSSAVHTINLEYKGIENREGKEIMVFELRHNASGDAPQVDEKGNVTNLAQFETVATYLSFAIENLIPEGSDRFPVEIAHAFYYTNETADGYIIKKDITTGDIARRGVSAAMISK